MLDVVVAAVITPERRVDAVLVDTTDGAALTALSVVAGLAMARNVRRTSHGCTDWPRAATWWARWWVTTGPTQIFRGRRGT